MSVLGNIALQTKSENPDLVENISITDINVLRCQKADGDIVERLSERQHHATVMSTQESMHK